MELTPELLASGVVGVIVVLGAIGQYLRTFKAKPPQDPVLAGVGIELGNREQTERVIAQLKRIADALTEKNASDISDRLEDLAEKVDEALSHRRASPPTRRRR